MPLIIGPLDGLGTEGVPLHDVELVGITSESYATHLMVEPGSTLIINILPLRLIHAMYDLVNVQMDLTLTFRLHLHHILVGP